MTDESIKTSNDLLRWLKLLGLPAWAEVALAVIMLSILLSAAGLLGWGLYDRDKNTVASALTILTVGLPLGLIVVALVFSDGGALKLKTLTTRVLKEEVPGAILDNLSPATGGGRYTEAQVDPHIRGCIADYALRVTDTLFHDERRVERTLHFKLELNVKKVNVVVWLPFERETDANWQQALERYKSCFFGAEKEGYVQNREPVLGEKPGHMGIVFIKPLGDDFLLNPAERLYFAQDLAFFIRGLLDTEASDGN